MPYNKDICISNIRFLTKLNNYKLGDVENRAGVSVGYFSKLLNSTADPSIETLSKLSKLFDVSIDYITSVDMEKMSENEIFILKFLEKLIKETKNNEYLWNKETKSFLNSISLDDEFDSHNFFYMKKVPVTTFNGTEDVNYVLFESEGRKENNYVIADDCFNCQLSNENRIFVMKIMKLDPYTRFINNIIDTEIYVQNNLLKALLCRKTHNEPSSLDSIIDELYLTAKESSKHVKINEVAKSIIDDFMNN